jgi:hypothetical protein
MLAASYEQVKEVAHDDYAIEVAAKLRAKAARYRDLAEAIFNPGLVAEIQAFARELELESRIIGTLAVPARRMSPSTVGALDACHAQAFDPVIVELTFPDLEFFH